jgi:hypothetical protein
MVCHGENTSVRQSCSHLCANVGTVQKENAQESKGGGTSNQGRTDHFCALQATGESCNLGRN